jgi:hypothetical protein
MNRDARDTRIDDHYCIGVIKPFCQIGLFGATA